LEEDLIELRRNTKLELQTLTEQDVEVKLSDLIRLRLQIEARLSSSHQVCGMDWDPLPTLHTTVEKAYTFSPSKCFVGWSH